MSEDIKNFRATISSLRSQLLSIQKKGISWIPFSAKTVFKAPPPEESNFTPVDTPQIPDLPVETIPVPTPQRPEERKPAAIQKENLKPVFINQNNGDAKIAFVRIAPSEKEYRDSAPFTDEAAKLLEIIIEKIGWDSSFVYKDYLCPYPVDYISPDSKNIAAWKHELLERLTKQSPHYVILFSERLSKIFFKSEKNVSFLRNNPLSHHSGMTFFASWDPFYFMKITKYKKPVWEDIQKINKLLLNIESH